LHVQHRFSEAIGTLLRMPLGHLFPTGYRTSWPGWERDWERIMAGCHNIEAMASEGRVSLDLLTAHRQWTMDRNAVRRDPPSAAEISFMERAIEWPGLYLRGRVDEARALNLIGFARASEVEVADAARRGKHHDVKSSSRWQELALEAAHRIAVGLRVDRVAVF
jgi:hypothetical protein